MMNHKPTHRELVLTGMNKMFGSKRDEYEIYRDCANDGNGLDITTGKPLKTFEEWLGV